MDKKVVCRLDDYINGKVNESNICIHKDDVFINDLQGDTLPVATGDGSATSIISTGKSFNRMYDDIRTCNKECANPAIIMKNLTIDKAINMKLDKNLEILNKIKVPGIFLNDINSLNLEENKELFNYLKYENGFWAVDFIDTLIENSQNTYFFIKDGIVQHSIIQMYRRREFTDEMGKKISQEQYEKDEFEGILEVRVLHDFNTESQAFINLILTDSRYQENFLEGRLLLIKLDIQDVLESMGHMAILIVEKQDDIFHFNVYDSASDNTFRVLKDLMKDNINVNVKSLNDNFYIQSFDYSNFRETMDMSLRDVAIDRENAIPVGNDIYNDLQKITDLSDIDSYDPKIRNFLEPSLDIQSLYKQLKGLNKENTHEKLEKIFYSQTKFAKFLNNKFKKKLEREFNKNEKLNNLMRLLGNYCATMSIRFAILVVLNPRVDLNTLARVDFNPNILRLNLFNNLQEYFFKLVSNFVYRDSLSESEKKDMEILQIKKISDSVDMRIYDALNTLKTLEPNLKKLSNLTLFIILSIYYKYMDNKIYYLKPANMPEFSMREMEISVDPLIFLSNDIIREDIIYKNMEMMRRNEDKIHIHEKIITREMFKYLYESIITYEEENKLFSNEDISSSGIKYKLFK